MRLSALLVFAAVFLTGCGHKTYDEFMNNMTSDQLGVLALVATPVFFVLFLAVNRRADPPSCRHAADPAMCYWARCRNGVANLFEVSFVCLFMIALGAGFGYANDPEGWLEMSTPLIAASPPR